MRYDVMTKAAGKVWPWNLFRRGNIASWVRDIRPIAHISGCFDSSRYADPRRTAVRAAPCVPHLAGLAC